MAPKRGTKQAKIVNNDEYKNLALADALCPICRYILVLPVTLPCNHNFCATCFEGTVANANLTCPLCRVRFASWLRIAKKEDRLTNGKLWHEIQAKFSDKVRNRQAGIEEAALNEGPAIKIASSGEIRREYEEQLLRDREELERQRRAEEAASAELIRKLKEEDALQEKLRRAAEAERRENTLKKRPLDKPMGSMHKHLSVIPIKHVSHADVQSLPSAELPQSRVQVHDLNACVASTSTCASTSSGSCATASSSRDGPPVPEKSTKQKNLMHFTEVIEISDSNDSIENEYRYFKPIDYRNIPPSLATTSPLKVQAVFNKQPSFKFEPPNKSNSLSFGEGPSAFVRFNLHTRKRKLSDKVLRKPTEPEHTMTLRDRKPSNASPPHLLPTASLLNGLKISAASRDEFSKLEQERADLELAKKLQEEFNRERYTTRSSISCRNNIKKARQLTLTEIMSTSKCK